MASVSKKDFTLCFSRNFQEIKRDRRLTQQELSAICDTTSYTIQGYVLGRQSPTLQHLIDYCDRLQVSPNQMMGGLFDEHKSEIPLIIAIEQALNAGNAQQQFASGRVFRILSESMSMTTPTLEGADFGTRIRILREDARISLTSFAESVGYAVGSVKCLEANQNVPSPHIVANICQALSVSPQYLLYPLLSTQLRTNETFMMLRPRQLAALAKVLPIIK